MYICITRNQLTTQNNDKYCPETVLLFRRIAKSITKSYKRNRDTLVNPLICTHIIHSLCGFDDVPGAVVIHMVLTADILGVAVVVMTLGFDFLKRKEGGQETQTLK